MMVATPSIAIDLPLKLLVWEDEQSAVWISYNAPAYRRARHVVPPEFMPVLQTVETLASMAAAT